MIETWRVYPENWITITSKLNQTNMFPSNSSQQIFKFVSAVTTNVILLALYII